MPKHYLGDGVYADLDGVMLILTTDYGRGPTNVIYLEPDVYAALQRFVERLGDPAHPDDHPSLFEKEP